MCALCGRVVRDGFGDRVHELCAWDVLVRDRREQRECVCFMSGGYVLGRLSCDKCEYVCVMPRRDAFKHGRRELFGRVHGLPDQHVFRGGSVVV